jgi:hypothetical protein
MRRNKTRRKRLRRGGRFGNVIKICNTNNLKGETYTKIPDTDFYRREGDKINKYTLAQISEEQQKCIDRGVSLNER